jgi:hypothetical protein
MVLTIKKINENVYVPEFIEKGKQNNIRQITFECFLTR